MLPTPNILQIPTYPKAVTWHPCLPSVPSLVSALSSEEKLHQSLSVFILAISHFLFFFNIILPLNTTFFFIWSIRNFSWMLLRFIHHRLRHTPSCCGLLRPYGCSPPSANIKDLQSQRESPHKPTALDIRIREFQTLQFWQTNHCWLT